MADDAKDEVEKAGEVKVMWRQGWLEHKVWGGGLSSRPSPLWPRREAPFSSAAACGSTVVETLRTKDKQRYYDIRGWPVMSTSAVQDKKKLLTWDVGQHDDDEAVVVVERHVIHVGESHGVHSSSAYERQRGVNGHQLSDDPQGVQNDEEGVSGEEERKISKMWCANRIHAAVTGSILEHTHA